MDEPMPETPMDDANQMPDNSGMESIPDDNANKKVFDTNFDAGVEADEDNDPKRYIQQLTGKLSQKLRDYNESLGEPDADLNKYVAGMIVKQAVDGLDGEDRSEIIKKVNDDEATDGPDSSENDVPMDDSNTAMNDDGMPMENKKRKGVSVTCTKRQLNKLSENFGGVNNMLDTPETDRTEKELPKLAKNKKINKPFISPEFK